jgi:superfamily I DNA/RNA helicase
MSSTHAPSTAQHSAIEAGHEPVLVIAGPGAGKTFCLIRRIRHLIEQGADPRRICAVTFTNKAAEEITVRLKDSVGATAEDVCRGTLHSLCLTFLRGNGQRVGLAPGFGVADEAYQQSILRRLRVPQRRHGQLLLLFGRRRLQDYVLTPEDEAVFREYGEVLATRNMIDFDGIIAQTGTLFREYPEVAREIAGTFDHVLVDEFQDLDPTQFDIVTRLAEDHRSIFAVGDDEQSIFSWRGAEPKVLARFRDEFGIEQPIVLDENRRCSSQIFAAARRLITRNPSLFDKELVAHRESAYDVEVYRFPDDTDEADWLLQDIQADHHHGSEHWGERAVLYRYHQTGQELEKRFIQAGVPCRLPRGRAMKDDDVIAYVMASLRIIARPDDPIVVEGFAERLLPRHLVEDVRARFQEGDLDFLGAMRAYAQRRPREDPDTKKAWRFVYHVGNLAASAETHDRLEPLVEELLSQRVGKYRNPLEERYEELSDPAADPATRLLADAFQRSMDRNRPIWIAPGNGLQIALRRLIIGAGLQCPVRYLVDDAVPEADDLVIDTAEPGLVVRLFKALQLVVAGRIDTGLSNFVCFDLETTDNDTDTCGVVEIGAVRVENGEIVDRFHSLVRPTVPIAAKATEVHGYRAEDLAEQSIFEEVWPSFVSFVGEDLLVAHNAHGFDVPVILRAASGLPGLEGMTFFDTLPLARSLFSDSAKLGDLATRFGVETGRAHHALDDAETLAAVTQNLLTQKAARARRSALVNVLDYLALAIALEGGEINGETAVLLDAAKPAALGSYSDSLDHYAAEREALFKDSAIPVEDVIDRLGGWQLVTRIRAARTARERYPSAMNRLMGLLEATTGETLAQEIERLLERVALSTSDGIEADPNRVSLLTVHSTKGLEFSRVYIVGVEDYTFPGYQATERRIQHEIEEARRLLYVGMTRARDRLVLTKSEMRNGKPSGGERFLEEIEGGRVVETVGR